ncbi:Uncharacterised protein [Chlamydia trachomatis]|nr:Uncharacterised protein [Chlamydia trachomatis]
MRWLAIVAVSSSGGTIVEGASRSVETTIPITFSGSTAMPIDPRRSLALVIGIGSRSPCLAGVYISCIPSNPSGWDTFNSMITCLAS